MSKGYVALVVVLIILFIGLYLYFFPIGGGRLEILGGEKKMQVFSTAFQDQGSIPVIYTKDGKDISPPISWVLPPNIGGVVCYALIMYDPDAPNPPFVHWILFNIPPDVNYIRENVPKEPEVLGVGLQGKNDYGEIGYGGPYPPKGSIHHYVFRVYALDSYLMLNAGCSKEESVKAVKDHVIVYGELRGIYGR